MSKCEIRIKRVKSQKPQKEWKACVKRQNWNKRPDIRDLFSVRFITKRACAPWIRS